MSPRQIQLAVQEAAESANRAGIDRAKGGGASSGAGSRPRGPAQCASLSPIAVRVKPLGGTLKAGPTELQSAVCTASVSDGSNGAKGGSAAAG